MRAEQTKDYTACSSVQRWVHMNLFEFDEFIWVHMNLFEFDEFIWVHMNFLPVVFSDSMHFIDDFVLGLLK